MKLFKSLLFICSLYSFWVSATVYFVNPASGNDTNDGLSVTTPFATFSKGLATIVAGDELNVYPGTFVYAGSITITKSNIVIRGVFKSASERPILDFSSQPLGDAYYGIQLKGSNCTVYGIVIKGAGDNGLLINGGKYNRIEYCDFLENRDSGLQLKAGASFNKIINCDSYYNVDAAQGNADGFANKLDQAGSNYFWGCRAYQNSDDGWDGLIKDQTYTPYDTIINCWCFKNGYLKDGTKSAGNGNGFKLGGNNLNHRNYVTNCLSALNLQKGFDQNNGQGGLELYNCTAYGNLNTSNGNFSFPLAGLSGETLTIKNCISHENPKFGNLNSTLVQVTNSWSGFTVTDADFLSVDHTQMLLPRKSNGNLPDITFMHLAAGSDLIDAGTVISGISYAGNKPDLGCFETTITALDNTMLEAGVNVFPNPANDFVEIESEFELGSVSLYNAQGLLVQNMANIGEFSQKINLSGFARGVYSLNIFTGGKNVKKLLVVGK